MALLSTPSWTVVDVLFLEEQMKCQAGLRKRCPPARRQMHDPQAPDLRKRWHSACVSNPMQRGMVGVLLTMFLGGCGTMNNLGEGPHVYGGVRSVGRYHEPMGNFASYCDLPFSFAMDTAILPVTSLAELSRWITGWPGRSYRASPLTDLEGRTAVAKKDLSSLDTALVYYRAWAGSYPGVDVGLKAVYRKKNDADPAQWDGIYLRGDGPPLDPWGQPYVYRFPGIRNPKGYDLFSSGPDRTPGTSDDINAE